MHRSFVQYFCVTFLIGSGLIVGFNYLMDPYGIYSVRIINGINDQKLGRDERITKAINLIQKKPKTVILGSSRVAAFSDTLMKTYDESVSNAGFAGADFDEIYSYFLHAVYLQPELKRVIVGIDLFAFNKDRKPASDFSETRMQQDSMILSDKRQMLYSAKVTSKSFKTLCNSIYNQYGLLEPEVNPILEMGENTYLDSMLLIKGHYKDYKLDPKKIQKFESMAEICRQKNIELIVYTSPVRAMYWDFYLQHGLWSQFEKLKWHLCSAHPLWDFSGFNPLTMETFDSDGERLYEECSHFTPYVANLLIKRMLNQPSPFDTLGYLLTPESFETVNAEILQPRDLWVQTKSSP